MESVKKILFFAVGLIMTVGFIAICMSLFNRSKQIIEDTSAQYDEMIGMYSDIQYARYGENDSTVSGSEVKRLISELDMNGISIYVKNGVFLKSSYSDELGVVYVNSLGNVCGYGGDREKTDYSTACMYMKDKSRSMYYINPSATFTAYVEKNDNGVIDAIYFEQK